MATPEENRERVLGFGHEQVVELLAHVLDEACEDWDEGAALEYLILRAFQIEGATVRYHFYVHDPAGKAMEQMDGVVYWRHHSFLVETTSPSRTGNCSKAPR